MTYTLLSCIDSKIIDPTKFYGRFELGTFAPGQGLTVANALRRSLLSELTGTAITLVQINGASHEYDTLSGMRECILDLLLNLKQIILTSDFELFTAQVGFLNVKGPAIVRARDLKLPFFIYCIDPDQYIATLTNQGQLNMKFLINCGKNHLTHSPSSSHYFDWVNLLKKEQPTALKTDTMQDNVATNVYQKWTNERQSHLQSTFQNSGFNQINFNIKKNSHSSNNNLINNETINSFNNGKFLANSSLDKTNSQMPFNKENLSKNSFLQYESQTNKIGYFPIDAIFAPITRVNYTVESQQNLNIAKETIILEIWTNGTINPRHAIHKAVKSLIQLFLPLQQMKTSIYNKKRQWSITLNGQINDNDQFNNAIQIADTKSEFNTINTKKQPPTDLITSNNKTTAFVKGNCQPNCQNKFQQNLKNVCQLDHLVKLNNLQKQSSFNNKIFKINSLSKFKILQLDLINLNLSSRPYLALKKANINTIKDLITKSKQQLLVLENFNQAYLIEVETALKKYAGLSLQ